MSQLRRASIHVALILTFLFPQIGKAEAGREFLLSCTYGVLAGALLGAASLAVEDDPGDKIHRIARGASLGLYSGIILGLYVVYVVPNQYDDSDTEQLEQIEEKIEPGDYGRVMRMKIPKLSFYPVIEQNKITGAAFNYNVVRF